MKPAPPSTVTASLLISASSPDDPDDLDPEDNLAADRSIVTDLLQACAWWPKSAYGVPVRRVLLVSSSGGVLPDLLALEPWWGRYDVRWVAVDAPDTRELLADQRVRWTEELGVGRLDRVLAAVPAARSQLQQARVDLLISAGSGVAVPWFLAARTTRVRAVWVETFNIVDRTGLAARLCARLADHVVVQRPHLLERHRRAVNVGELW
ncbi:MAG TPA: hypothetical protein VLM05_16485 [Mycobacteriales bacterium]|nr:hypothetical protein [Mycobacteriales bacterium]